MGLKTWFLQQAQICIKYRPNKSLVQDTHIVYHPSRNFCQRMIVYFEIATLRVALICLLAVCMSPHNLEDGMVASRIGGLRDWRLMFMIVHK